MPLRSARNESLHLGVQRPGLVPKCTPLSSSCRIVYDRSHAPVPSCYAPVPEHTDALGCCLAPGRTRPVWETADRWMRPAGGRTGNWRKRTRELAGSRRLTRAGLHDLKASLLSALKPADALTRSAPKRLGARLLRRARCLGTGRLRHGACQARGCAWRNADVSRSTETWGVDWVVPSDRDRDFLHAAQVAPPPTGGSRRVAQTVRPGIGHRGTEGQPRCTTRRARPRIQPPARAPRTGRPHCPGQQDRPPVPGPARGARSAGSPTGTVRLCRPCHDPDGRRSWSRSEIEPAQLLTGFRGVGSSMIAVSRRPSA